MMEMRQMINNTAGSRNKEGGATGLSAGQGLPEVGLPLEIRVHGRGGQGGVTCAKLCAFVYSGLGLFTQTFGDYGMERAGAPVRAYTRVDRKPITNRNKVYAPGHLLILDPSLFGAGVLDGAIPGAVVLLNSREAPASFQSQYKQFRFATVNATDIARKHGIGTSAVVIVNTSMVGAYARSIGLPIETLEGVYASLGLQSDLPAAVEAYHAVLFGPEPQSEALAVGESAPPQKSAPDVIPLTELTTDMPTPLKTGSWRTQSPLYSSFQAPCAAVCPAGNSIPGIVQALKNNGVEEAAIELLKTQPLPAVCGRVCPAPCMGSCNRTSYDGSVNIRGLERWIGDHAGEVRIEPEATSNPLKAAIIGSGPAGLATGFFLARAGHSVTIYESEPKIGGLLRTAIPSYRLPEDVLDRDLRRILALGVEARCGERLDSQRLQDLAQACDAVVIATGQAISRTLECPGVELPGVEQGLLFLDRAKKEGGARLTGTVAVIGGGNAAMDCARTALRCGADKVVVVYRRGREEMPAIREEIEGAIAEGAELVLHFQPVRFLGDKRVTGIELAHVELGDPDASGRRRPVVTDKMTRLSCDYALPAAGQYSDMAILPSEWRVTDGRAYLSDRPLNVWLAGDLATAAGTVAHAVGNGRSVALDVIDSLVPHWSVETGARVSAHEVVSAESIKFFQFPRAEPRHDRHLALSAGISGFQEVNMGLADESEAERCFSCGLCARCDICLTYCPEGVINRDENGYVINGEYCKGCGICVRECPRQAMRMTAEGYRSKA
jgi:2-oxoacid:acceptor oxidoreductase gamma subunit (pyruvate/2-ketoisovalerate family)